VRVWIDLSNSPHPLLFAPIARRLEEQGDEVLLTVRDHAQTAELARERWPGAPVIGRGWKAGRAAKIGALGGRVVALARWGREHRAQVALSHNSYSQAVAARLIGVPLVTAMDFEHQPANHLAFRLARRVLVPEAVPVGALARQGARGPKLVRYDGLKEEVYLADAEPDRAILSALGLTREADTVIAIARSAAADAAYHRGDNPVFLEMLETLDKQANVRTIVLARLPDQRAAVRELGLERAIVPEHAIDARSLLYSADAFVGAGGTMTREAALLGLDTYSLFAGKRPAVDRWLEETGRLRMIEGPADLPVLRPGAVPGTDAEAIRWRGARIVERFADTVHEVGGARS
jgi:predicted glycosyltransferase